MKPWLLGVLLALGAESTNLTDEVATLVAKLDADALAVRAEAEQALIKLGPAALQSLPEVTERTPAETAQRLARIRQALEQAQIKQAAEPTRITLESEDLPLADAIAQLSQATGNRIVDHRAEFGEEITEPRVKLHWKNVSFWQALDDLLDQANLSVYDYAGERGVYLVNHPPQQKTRTETASYAGPFRLEALRFEAERDLRQPQLGALRLFLGVAWEPRLRPVALRQPLDQLSATGSDGQPLDFSDAEGVPEATVTDETSSAELQLSLTPPARKVERIASLKGKLIALVPGPLEQFRFDQLPIAADAKAGAGVAKVEKRKAGVTVTIDQVRKNNEVWEARLRVKFDKPSNSLESHRAWIFRNDVYLVGADKKRIEPGGFEQTRQTEDEVGIAYLFDLPQGPKGLSLVYSTPTAVFDVPIEYELKDLPLP